PPCVMPATERRMLHLSLFSELVNRSITSRALEMQIAENLEAAHQLSAVRRWLVVAEMSSPDEARAYLLRAFRLAAQRGRHEAMPEILRGLSVAARKMNRQPESVRWSDAYLRVQASVRS
ncbi:MAG: hypothetical protein KC561_00625, partial [Myxococcales bacterium]|nr:hypothetical protein [Myxococcales bacterium]